MIKRTRQNLIEDIKVLKANQKTLRQFAKDKYVDEEGVANIDIYVTKDQLFDPLTNPENPEISQDIIQLIERESNYIPIEYPIRVRFHSSDNLDKEYVEKKLKEYYWKQLADKDDDLKNNAYISIILLIIGVVLLSSYLVIRRVGHIQDILGEILSVAGTFAIWESVDYFLLNRNAIKIQKLNVAQLALLDVEIK